MTGTDGGTSHRNQPEPGEFHDVIIPDEIHAACHAAAERAGLSFGDWCTRALAAAVVAGRNTTEAPDA